jgi:hypothetical protein
MGRLTKRQRRQLWRVTVTWLPPIVLVLVLLFGVRSLVKADPAPSTSELASYLQQHELGVYDQPNGNYQQVYYNYNGNQIDLTDASYNHVGALSSGQYVTWEGTIDGDQIFQYDVLADTLTQLTFDGTNDAPSPYQGTVTWQHWDGSNWQIMYFDGSNIQQITNDDDSSVRPSTNGQQIIYAEEVATDDWKAQSYDIASGQTSTIREGDEASTAYPEFASDGTITTAFQAE